MEQETLIYIDDKQKYDASAIANTFTDKNVKNRSYMNTLGAELAIRYLESENIKAADTKNIHSIKKILEEFDISDIRLDNINIDVRVVYDENAIFIPKSQFEYDLTPDIYVVMKIEKDFSAVKFLGFFEPKLINKNNANDEYYFIEKEKLSSPYDLANYIKSYNLNKNKDLSEEEISKMEGLMLSMIDNDISEADEKYLLKGLTESSELREKFIEYENFEFLSYKAMHDSSIDKHEPASDISTLDEFETFEVKDLNETDDIFEASDNTILDDLSDNDNKKSSDSIVEAGLAAGGMLGAAALEGVAEEVDLTENVLDTADNVIEAAGDGIDSIAENTTEGVEILDELPTEEPENKNDIEELNIDNIEDISPEEVDLTENILDTADNVIEAAGDGIDSIAENTTEEAEILDELPTEEPENKNDIEELNFDNIEDISPEEVDLTENVLDTADNAIETVGDRIDSIAENTTEGVEILDELPAEEPENKNDIEELNFDNIEDISPEEVVLEADKNDEPVSLDNVEFENISQEEDIVNNDDELVSLSEDLPEVPEEKFELNENIEPLSLEDVEFHHVENKNEFGQSEIVSLEGLDLKENQEVSENIVDAGADVISLDENIQENKLQAEEEKFEDIEKLDLDNLNTSDSNKDDSTLNEEEVLSEDIELGDDRSDDEKTESFGKNLLENLSADDIEDISIEQLDSDENNVDVGEISSDELLSQIDNVLTSSEQVSEQETKESEIDQINETDENEKQKDYIEEILDDDSHEDYDLEGDPDKLNVLYTGADGVSNADIDEIDNINEMQEQENVQPETQIVVKNNNRTLKIAAVTVIVLAAAATLNFMIKPKGEQPADLETISNTEVTMPSENNSEMNILESNAPAVQKEDTSITNKTAEVKELKTDVSKKTLPRSASMSVSRIVWDVPDNLSYSTRFQNFLRTAGKSLKVSLSADLLLSEEYAYSNSVKISLNIGSNGSIKSCSVLQSSGSKQIDNIVLQSVKETLNVVKPPVDELKGQDFKLNLIIYF